MMQNGAVYFPLLEFIFEDRICVRVSFFVSPVLAVAISVFSFSCLILVRLFAVDRILFVFQ
jgi:hypothetical protein